MSHESFTPSYSFEHMSSLSRKSTLRPPSKRSWKEKESKKKRRKREEEDADAKDKDLKDILGAIKAAPKEDKSNKRKKRTA